MNIGQKLKDRRKELGLTMFEVAKKANVSEATVSRWESGDIANMRRDKIVSLAKALKVTPAYIMGCEEYPFQIKESIEREIEKIKAMVPIEDLNIRLKQAMEKKNIQLLELSQKTGISENTIRKYLSGQIHPSQEKMHLLCKTLKVSHNWLSGYDVPMEVQYYSKNYELSAEEEHIISIFRNLNKLGQDRLLEYSVELNEISKYILKK